MVKTRFVSFIIVNMYMPVKRLCDSKMLSKILDIYFNICNATNQRAFRIVNIL